MNERLKELALKAYNNAGQGTPEALSSFMEVYSEKFAELIVKACAAFIDSHEQLDKYGEPYEMVYGKDVLKHFGVEE